jgi:phosphoribosylanthranilate isomerase
MMNPLDNRTRIKICGLTREQDVDAAVAAGADAVGFVVYEKSPRFVSAQRAGELARRLPPFVTPVLLFVNADTATIQAALDAVPAAMLQFHGDETAPQCATLARGRPFMRAARIPLDSAAGFDLLKFATDYSQAQAILLDAHVEGYGGGGKAFDWSLIPSSSVHAGSPGPALGAFHLVLSGGLTPANVTDGIAQVRPRCKTLAVDVSSGVEASKGVKDAARINQFVAAVRAADALLARSPNALLSAT